MKRLLTIVLTLVMLVYLNNIENSHAKAEDGNAAESTLGILIQSNTIKEWNGTSFANMGDERKTTLGITFASGSGTTTAELTLSKNIEGTSVLPTIRVSSDTPLNITFDKKISIENTAKDAALNIQANTKIDGKGNELILLNNGGNHVIYLDDNIDLILKDLTLVCEHTANNANANLLGSLSLQGEVLIELTNNQNGSEALKFKADTDVAHDVHFSDDAPIKIKVGNADPIKINLEPVKKNIGTGTKGIYIIDNPDGKKARYIKIQQSYKSPEPEPTPTPSPSEPVVKDESCEKVIGPTWHWNNDKGICEEYSTVGTSTR